MSKASRVLEKACLFGSCLEYKNFIIDSDSVLHLCLDAWSIDLQTHALESYLKNYSYISLTLDNPPSFSKATSSWIIKIVLPKVVEITIINCDLLPWTTIKKMLDCAKNITSLRFRKNNWVNDKVIEHIAYKFGKSLKILELENCKISDISLFQLNRSCFNLSHIYLTCCPNITDAGLRELSKKIHLCNIHISHNMHISDVGIEQLLISSSHLDCLELKNIPKLTNSSLSSIYESNVAWGKKRNERASNMSTVILTDSSNFTDLVINWISFSATKIDSIDLSECLNLDLTAAMHFLEALEFITCIRLGPCAIPVVEEPFLQSMSCHAHRLVTLHLADISLLTDFGIATIIVNCEVLVDLSLSDMDFGTQTVEAICSTIPNIASLVLVNSQIIDNRDIRCISAICLNLKHFSVQDCAKITDEGFSRCPHLHLEHLNLSRMRHSSDGTFLVCFTKSSLIQLKCDNSKLSISSSYMSEIIWNRITPQSKASMRYLSFRNCLGLSMGNILLLLEHFIFLNELDLTGCEQLYREMAAGIAHTNPFIEYCCDEMKDFVGYRTTQSNAAKMKRFIDIRLQYLKEYSVQKIIKQYRKYGMFKCELKQREVEYRERQRQQAAAHIVNFGRTMLYTFRLRKKLKAGRRIVRVAKRYCNEMNYAKFSKATRYYRKRLMGTSFSSLLTNKKLSTQSINHRTQRVISKNSIRLERRYFNIFKSLQSQQKELKYCDNAESIWEERFLRQIVTHWKRGKGEERRRKTKLVNIFMSILPIKVLNSTKQLASIAAAENFMKQRLLIPTWIAFADDYIRALKAAQLMPMAIKYFLEKFLKRVCGQCFKAINVYRLLRKHKKLLKKQGDAQHTHFKSLIGGRYIWNNRVRSLIAKFAIKKSLAWRIEYRFCVAVIIKFPKQVERKKRYRNSIVKSLICALMSHWTRVKNGVIRMKKWRLMNLLAITRYETKRKKAVVGGWHKYVLMAANINEYMWQKYTDRLCKKAFRGFHMNIQENKEFRMKIQRDLEEHLASQQAALDLATATAAEIEASRLLAEQKMKILVASFTKLQAYIRRKLQLSRYKKLLIASEWATQTLQNFIRVALARKRWRQNVRLATLKLRKKEEKELDAMREAEAETRFYDWRYNALITIQRVARGMIGRNNAYFIARHYTKLKAVAFYDNMVEIRKNYERELRLAAAKEAHRHRSATIIQKRVRGMQQRARFKVMKQQAAIAKVVIVVQRVYRGRLARLQLNAVRRAKTHEFRYKAARQQRGLLLRMLGINKRRKQFEFSSTLTNWGFEPITFNYRVNELCKEIYDDFFVLKETLIREYNIYKETKGNKALVLASRRQYFNARDVALKLQDTVLIIEAGHNFYGHTGIIVRIDKSVPGEPLYEIKLDDCPRQTFVHMTTDGFSYYMTYPQPVWRIPTKPSTLKYLAARRPEIITATEDPFFAKHRVFAALKIQMRFRIFAAKRRVDRRRYEVWMRQADTQRSLINELQSTNTLTFQAYDFTKALKLRPTNNIKFDEIRNSVQSSRLLAVKNSGLLKSALEWESAEKHRQRWRFLEVASLETKKRPFLIGWKKLSPGRQFALMFMKCYGLMTTKFADYSDIIGGRGIRQRSQRHNLVTGMSNYKFTAFTGSPHVRFEGLCMYQGEWDGIPLVTPLRPHGLGLVVFYDAWGFSKENKVLKLTIVRARGLMTADITSSDPFCEIKCNGKNLQTSVKWSNLDPVWNEKFDIDVSNIDAGLNIVVKDKDYFSSDDFLGQVLIDLHEVADGKRVRRVYDLKGENVNGEDFIDRGTLEIQMHWVDRVYDDDIGNIALENESATRMQAWARRIAAKELFKKMKIDNKIKMQFLLKQSIKITNTCRIRLARKEFKRLLRRWKAALKIQKRVRIRIAKNKYKKLCIRKVMAIKIQRIARGYNARHLLVRLRKERKLLLNNSATRIQRIARKMIALIVMTRMREEIAFGKAQRKKMLLKKLNNEDDTITIGSQSYESMDKDDMSVGSVSTTATKEKKTTSRTNNTPADKKTSKLNDKTESKAKDNEASKKSGKGNKEAKDSKSNAKSDKSSKKADEKSSPKKKEAKDSQQAKETPDGSLAQPSVDLSPSLTQEEMDELNALMDETPVPISSWIDTYGTDPEYGLRRNRRITERGFKKMLKIRYIRLQTVKYGVVFLDQYPPPITMEEEQELSVPLRKREDFVRVFFPSQTTNLLKRPHVVEMVGNVPREGYIHISTSMDVRKSVHMVITMIQCLARQYIANNAKKVILKLHASIAKFQRIFRRKNQRQHASAFRIQSLYHYNIANKRSKLARLERKSAIFIQCAYRMWLAKIAEMNLRSVTNVRVLKYSSKLPLAGPEYCLDMKGSTFWVAESTTTAEIRVELPVKEAIDAVWIMTSTYEACPKFVTIEVVLDKASKEYYTLFSKIPLPRRKGLFWIPFRFKSKISKYFKLTFDGNYGDKNFISIRQIRFLRAREKSATIIRNPDNAIIPVGPTLGEESKVTMSVESEGWPLPTFQWYCNGKKMRGETNPTLTVTLFCAVNESTTRSYRCSKCKNICSTTPGNAYQVICMNCTKTFDYKEIKEYFAKLHKIHAAEDMKRKELQKLLDTKHQMLTSGDEQIVKMVPQILEQIGECESLLHEMRIARYEIKGQVQFANRYKGEGSISPALQYHLTIFLGLYICNVMNYRGGTVFIKRRTTATVVVVEETKRYPLITKPFYNPRRKRIRHNWNLYSSIYGTMTAGKIEGIVVIRYVDGSVYEGPYVDESKIDTFGLVPPNARMPNHWGVYTCGDGRVFEGFNVDNHFDVHNIQGYFKLTLPLTAETYEGNFVDERYHGAGVFRYADGSIYEGEWHMGKRYGHGYFKSPPQEGWVYEGNFDNDNRHGDGMIYWPDGTTYVGHVLENTRTGLGIYITKMRDVYKGEFKDNKFHGKGEIVYNNGSRYIGDFVNGLRQGKGIFIDRLGTEHFGEFLDDAFHGDHVVKRFILEADPNTLDEAFELSMAQYDRGKFVCWVGDCVNPLSTQQFIRMFEEDRKAFDGVYTLMLTKYMPKAPRGIDTNHPDVAKILKRIRIEGGMLIGTDALRDAREQLNMLLPNIRHKKEEIEKHKKDINMCVRESRALDNATSVLQRQHRNQMEVIEGEIKIGEQFWIDDPLERKAKHEYACKQLSLVKLDDWFFIKNHRQPAPFLKKIFDSCSYLLNLSLDWKQQQMLISDFMFNSHNGDPDAIRFNYECKLIHLLEHYDVFDYLTVNEEKDMALLHVMSDPKFRRDSYYVEACGDAAPYMIDWIKANYAYAMAARSLMPARMALENKKIIASRLKNVINKRIEDYQHMLGRIDRVHHLIDKKEAEMLIMQQQMEKAYNVVSFVNESYELGRKPPSDYDYYELMEMSLVAEQDRFNVETAMEGLLNGVEEKIATEKMNLRLSQIAAGLEVVEMEETHVAPNIKEWIDEEIFINQGSYLEQSIGLGYTLEPNDKEMTMFDVGNAIQVCVDNTVLRLNDYLHEEATTTKWVMPKGKVVFIRIIYILCWKVWKDNALRIETEKACAAWENIFGDTLSCAKMAIQSKVNWRMSAAARQQATIYAATHPREVKEAETILASEFADQNGPMELTPSLALEYSEDDTNTIEPDVKAGALCWTRTHPAATQNARDQKDLGISKEFEKAFPDETALHCFEVLNGLCHPTLLDWAPYAIHWKNFNSELYLATQDNQVNQMAAKFKEAHIFHTAIEAAKVVENDAISKLMQDPETAAELWPGFEEFYNARCWAMKNQGRFGAGMKAVDVENRTKYIRFWNEFRDLSVDFTKGSYITVTSEAKMNPSLDRFFGFRARLEKRYSWMYAYILRRQYRVNDRMQILQALGDPSQRIYHNIRPSSYAGMIKKLEKEYLRDKKECEDEMKEIFEKLSLWNTYFGTVERAVIAEQMGQGGY